jgi:3-oxoadipate enol-lactonase
MPSLHTSQAHIYFETQGESGPWITLINGHTRSSKDFKLLARSLIAAGFQCLTFDNRGSGVSQTLAPYSARDMVNDVYALWDKIGIKKSFLVGISMGGMLAEVVAAERDISGLILISTSAGQHDLSPISFGEWGTSIESVAERMRHYFTEDFARRNRLLVEAMNKQILAAIQNEGFAERAREQRLAVEQLDNRPLLGKIRSPTLIIHGSADRIIEPRAAHALQAMIPKAELMMIEGAGHLLLAERSKVLADAIVDFCQAHRA